MRPIEIYLFLKVGEEKLLAKKFREFMADKTEEQREEHIYQIFDAKAEAIRTEVELYFKHKKELELSEYQKRKNKAQIKNAKLKKKNGGEG